MSAAVRAATENTPTFPELCIAAPLRPKAFALLLRQVLFVEALPVSVHYILDVVAGVAAPV